MSDVPFIYCWLVLLKSTIVIQEMSNLTRWLAFNWMIEHHVFGKKNEQLSFIERQISALDPHFHFLVKRNLMALTHSWVDIGRKIFHWISRSTFRDQSDNYYLFSILITINLWLLVSFEFPRHSLQFTSNLTWINSKGQSIQILIHKDHENISSCKFSFQSLLCPTKLICNLFSLLQ